MCKCVSWSFLRSFLSATEKAWLQISPTTKDRQLCHPASLKWDQDHKNMKKQSHQQIKMFKIPAPAAARVQEDSTRCGLCSTLQPPIVIHHAELLRPLNIAAIQAQASAYIADIPPEPHPTNTRKYLIIQKEPVLLLLLQTCGTIFRSAGEVSVMFDQFQIRSVPVLKWKLKVGSQQNKVNSATTTRLNLLDKDSKWLCWLPREKRPNLDIITHKHVLVLQPVLIKCIPQHLLVRDDINSRACNRNLLKM